MSFKRSEFGVHIVAYKEAGDGDHSISGANRLLVMKVPSAFLHEPMSIYSAKMITRTEEEHEQHRSDGVGVSTAYLDPRNQSPDLASPRLQGRQKSRLWRFRP